MTDIVERLVRSVKNFIYDYWRLMRGTFPLDDAEACRRMLNEQKGSQG